MVGVVGSSPIAPTNIDSPQTLTELGLRAFLHLGGDRSGPVRHLGFARVPVSVRAGGAAFLARACRPGLDDAAVGAAGDGVC